MQVSRGSSPWSYTFLYEFPQNVKYNTFKHFTEHISPGQALLSRISLYGNHIDRQHPRNWVQTLKSASSKNQYQSICHTQNISHVLVHQDILTRQNIPRSQGNWQEQESERYQELLVTRLDFKRYRRTPGSFDLFIVFLSYSVFVAFSCQHLLGLPIVISENWEQISFTSSVDSIRDFRNASVQSNVFNSLSSPHS